MSNEFAIRITAIDGATKVVDKINKSIGRAFQPYDRAKRSALSFFNAVGKNDLVTRSTWGLQVLGGAVGNFSSSFGIAENSVMAGSARMAASLGAIGGPIGGFISGAIAVAGATTAIGVKMAGMGFDVARTAKNLNVTTDHLQEYRGAAKLAGLETEAMDSAMGGLGTTLQDALAGRNLQVATLLSQMGITIRKTKDGAVDTVAAMRVIADVVSKIGDQNMARKAADMLGLGQVLPLLREGTKQLDEWIAQVRRAGGVMSEDMVNANKKQADAWNQTKAAIDGMGVSLGNVIAQVVPIDRMANKVSAFAEEISKMVKARDDAVAAGTRPAGIAGGWTDYKEWVRNFWGAEKGAPTNPRVASGPVTNPNGSIYREVAAGAGRGRAQVPAEPSAADGGAGAGRGFTQPRGIRNNNPGNLNFAGQAGASKEEGPGGRFATFESPELGITALAKNLVAYQDKYGINTIEKIINRWAPPSENNTRAYVGSVAKETGRKSDEALNLRDPAVLAPLISSIIKHENGQNPYSAEAIAKAAAAAVREAGAGDGSGEKDRAINLVVHNVPPGMTIKAVRGLGQSSIGLTMAPGGAS